MVVSRAMMASRQMEGFWTDWANADPASSSWDWSVDFNQRTMLWKARERGVEHFELFSNSPMWWMCKNHNPSGDDNGGDNLQPWNVDQHAHYLAIIARRARDNWGIIFDSVEPFNEPTGGWWKGKEGSSEGCHFDASAQAPVINALRRKLNEQGLSSTMVAASDENGYDVATSTLQALGDNAGANVGRVNVHGYQHDGRRDLLYALATTQGRKLWNSEYGEGDLSGRTLVSNLILDLRWLHPVAWVYWQVLDQANWGLIDANNETGEVHDVTQKYYVLAQFTRHIRPGMRILDGGSDNVVAAYDTQNQKLVIVAVNWGNSQYLNFELSRFSQPSNNGATVRRWHTQIGSGEQYADHLDTFMSGTRFWSWFDSNAVQTFEVDNVNL